MNGLDDETLDRGRSSVGPASERGWALTIAWHPDVSRVGERVWMEGRSAAKISRKAPLFAVPGHRGAPLAEPGISRAPFSIRCTPEGGLEIRREEHAAVIDVDGVPLDRDLEVSREAFERGVVLELASRVLLVARPRAEPTSDAPDALGLVGTGEAISTLREQIRKVADVEVPVLIGGESGTGKELVARAIAELSARRDRPFVAVNLAATPPAVAASELFGHVKGAFTGADRARAGLFEEADGGTLFLDEIGDAPLDLQVMLLRALETSEVRPVGASSTKRVDVRVIAATDTDLEGAIARGSFREALLQRLAGYRIAVPALRERREDIGLLFATFVQRELASIGLVGRLDPSAEKPWLGSRLVARLLTSPWTGNVRQLRNAARQLVIDNRDRESARLDPVLERLLDLGAPEVLPPPTASGRLPDDDAALVELLRQHRFELRRVARVLGISRSSLYARIDKSTLIRKARDVSKEEIESVRAQVGPDLEAMAEKLEVSPRGLKLRMRELEMA